MDSSVPDNGALATGSTPKLNSLDGTALDRVANGEESGVAGEGRLQVHQELIVLREGVVRVEVRDGRDSSHESLGLVGSCRNRVSLQA